VKANGDKITFVDDGGGKSCDVLNAETLKEHVGHHIELSPHLYKDKGQIHVISVTMLKEQQPRCKLASVFYLSRHSLFACNSASGGANPDLPPPHPVDDRRAQ
jgi:hypothetical protein